MISRSYVLTAQKPIRAPNVVGSVDDLLSDETV
jgi:hypothetical protein